MLLERDQADPHHGQLALQWERGSGDEEDEGEEEEGDDGRHEVIDAILGVLLERQGSAGEISEEELIAEYLENSPDALEEIETEEQMYWMQEAVHRIIEYMIEEGIIVADRAQDKRRPETRPLRVPPAPP